jgi:hypothetical protein
MGPKSLRKGEYKEKEEDKANRKKYQPSLPTKTRRAEVVQPPEVDKVDAEMACWESRHPY